MASQSTTSTSSSTLGHEPTVYTPPTSTIESSTISDVSVTETDSGTLPTSSLATTTFTRPPLSGSSTSSTSTSTSISTNPPSNVTSSSSRSLPIGSIMGGLIGALALVLLFVFLVLKHRSSQNKKRSVEVDTQATPFGVNRGERLGGYVSVNIGPRSVSRRLSSPLMSSPIGASATSHLTPDHLANYAHTPNTNTFSIPPRKFGAQTTGTLHPPTQEEVVHLATMHTSNPNQGHFQTTFTNASASSNHTLDFAPPAYDSLTSTNPSRRRKSEPS